MKITKLNNSEIKDQAEQIFKLTLPASSLESHDYAHFSEVYFNYYLSSNSLFLVAINEGNVMGYICGSLNSNSCSFLFENLKHYSYFKEFYSQYPAHLHINCHPDAQGKGVGSELIQEYCSELLVKGVKGVHLITAKNARNVSFYLRNGFHQVSSYQNLLLLGKSL
jgi:ribosomal protein S18 acetylase RimI-like enzyme